MFGAEYPVAGITQARHDVGNFVQALIYRRDVDGDFRMCLFEHPDTFGCCDQGEKPD